MPLLPGDMAFLDPASILGPVSVILWRCPELCSDFITGVHAALSARRPRIDPWSDGVLERNAWRCTIASDPE